MVQICGMRPQSVLAIRSKVVYTGWMRKGSKHTAIAKKKNKLAHLGETSGMKGKKHTEAAKQKNRLAHLGKKLTIKHRKRIGDFFRGKKLSQAHKDKIGNAQKGEKNHMWRSDIVRAKNCRTCGKSFEKRYNISKKTWNTTTFYCSVRCATTARAKWNKGENHYNWKGGFDPKKYLAAHPEIYEARKKVAREKEYQKRLLVLQFYSKSKKPSCNCCGEKMFMFLAIDHIENNGSKHRKEIGVGKSRMVDWLIKNDFPTGFQILCQNCNMGKHFNKGICPHKTL